MTVFAGWKNFLMVRRFRNPWLLLLTVTNLVVAGGIWWIWFRVPELRLVARYPQSELNTLTSYGFFLQERAGKGIAYCAYDWSGQLLSRSTPLPLPPKGASPGYASYLSPDHHWLLTSLLQGDGTSAVWTLWHYGQMIRSETLPACPFVEMRNDGTAWLFGSTGATLQIYAMQAKRTFTARDRVPHISDDVFGFGHPILSCAILPSDPVIPSWGESPGELSGDGTTLTINAYRRDGCSHDTQMPCFAIYKLHIGNDRLTVRRTHVDTSKLTPPLYSRPAVKVGVMPHTPPKLKPVIPYEARIGMGTTSEWRIPNWQRFPQDWSSIATSDYRYALVTYTDKHQQIVNLLRSLHLLRDAHMFFTCEVYERPGILGGRVRIRCTSQYPYAWLAPNGPVVLVQMGDDVLLYSK